MNMEGSTIALVEDDASFRRAIERLLRASGLEVKTFASAEELLGSVAPESHACLILDVQLPGMSGFELFDQLAASGHARPAVFISAHEADAVRERTLRVPESVFLRKPFVGAKLLDVVHSMLKRNGPGSEASVR
jgi:FixJ family two-component response regulator